MPQPSIGMWNKHAHLVKHVSQVTPGSSFKPWQISVKKGVHFMTVVQQDVDSDDSNRGNI